MKVNIGKEAQKQEVDYAGPDVKEYSDTEYRLREVQRNITDDGPRLSLLYL